jgi:hypothetical protein
MEWSCFAIFAFVYIFNLLIGVEPGTKQIIDIVGLVLIFIAGAYPFSPWRRP